MKRLLVTICSLLVVAVIAAPAIAAPAAGGTVHKKTGNARLIGDPVALDPSAPRTDAVKCPSTQCVPVFISPPEFDPSDPEGGGEGTWQLQCVYVQGSNTRCDSQWPGTLCSGTFSCNGLSY
jgi:hypothetical protein